MLWEKTAKHPTVKTYILREVRDWEASENGGTIILFCSWVKERDGVCTLIASDSDAIHCLGLHFRIRFLDAVMREEPHGK